jgi:hypothetical protein
LEFWNNGRNNTGILEQWNTGITGKKHLTQPSAGFFNFLLGFSQYSIFPIIHSSRLITPDPHHVIRARVGHGYSIVP